MVKPQAMVFAFCVVFNIARGLTTKTYRCWSTSKM